MMGVRLGLSNQELWKKPRVLRNQDSTRVLKVYQCLKVAHFLQLGFQC